LGKKAMALAMRRNNLRRRRGPTRFGIRREEGGGWPRIIFISLAQRRTGTIGTGSGERERRYRRGRRGHWREERALLLAGSPASSGFRPPVPSTRRLPEHRTGTAKSHDNGARLGTPPAYRNETRMPREECAVPACVDGRRTAGPSQKGKEGNPEM